jgi:nicotinamidase/pyrazinamidase
MSNALVLIDFQNDFCDENGSLYVPNAANDVSRFNLWLHQFGIDNIDQIFVSLDSHYKESIFFSNFWKDHLDNHPKNIVENKGIIEHIKYSTQYQRIDSTYTPKYPYLALNYMKKLSETDKELIIWPEHCLIGTWGHELHPTIKGNISDWEKFKQKKAEIVIKGTSQVSEHYGMFQAIVENEDPATWYNYPLMQKLNTYDTIYWSGEAASHCVADSISQYMRYKNNPNQKNILLKNTTSSIPGFEQNIENVINRYEMRLE